MLLLLEDKTPDQKVVGSNPVNSETFSRHLHIPQRCTGTGKKPGKQSSSVMYLSCNIYFKTDVKNCMCDTQTWVQNSTYMTKNALSPTLSIFIFNTASTKKTACTTLLKTILYILYTYFRYGSSNLKKNQFCTTPCLSYMTPNLM